MSTVFSYLKKGATMPQVTLEIPDELVTELTPYREHLLDLLRLGLAEQQRRQSREKSPKLDQVLQQMADEGKLLRPKPVLSHLSRARRSLIRVTGKPVSEIVIEQRNYP